MKRVVLLTAIFCLSFASSTAQKSIEGSWEGKLDLGSGSLRLVFHLQKDSAGFTGTMDSPDQGATGIKLSKVHFSNDSLQMEVSSIGGQASGRLENDSTFNGQWIQGISLPLELKRVVKPTVLNRPQTPKPPFTYFSRDTVYFNPDRSISYGATLTIPRKKIGRFPAVLLISGSGQQNRDEELFGHKPFAVLADYLTKNGFVVLRVDDRGIGQTTGDVESATSKDFAEDVNTGLDFLKTLPYVDKTKVGLLGHSEGGMIAQIVASERRDIAFVISLAGPGQKIDELMLDQNKAIMQASGLPSQAVTDFATLYKKLLPTIVNAASDSVAEKAAVTIFSEWVQETPKETVLITTGINKEEDVEKTAKDFVKELRSPWFTYFLKYDPDPFIRKMKAKVLVLNGEKDIQVLSKPNLAGWHASLKKSSVKKYDVIELKGLNHLFQQCRSCTVAEYGQIEQTLAPEALETIRKWLVENVK